MLCSHGYLSTSGLPTLAADYAQNVTVEGDNYLLTQQTARYLLKTYEQGRQGKKIGGFLSYLENVDAVLNEKCAAQDAQAFLNANVQVPQRKAGRRPWQTHPGI